MVSITFQACSGKFSPLLQWFYFDAVECLGESGEEIPEQAAAPQGSRYDGQIAIFGADFQKKLESQKYFLVGILYYTILYVCTVCVAIDSTIMVYTVPHVLCVLYSMTIHITIHYTVLINSHTCIAFF